MKIQNPFAKTSEGFFIYELHKLGYDFEKQKNLTFQQREFLKQSIILEREEKRKDIEEIIKAVQNMLYGGSSSQEAVKKESKKSSLVERQKAFEERGDLDE